MKMVIEYFYQDEPMVSEFIRLERATIQGKVFITFSEVDGDYLVIDSADIFDIRLRED